jgi:uncharacterized protein (UPF0305 family)
MNTPISANFTVDDIHNVRLQMAEEYSKLLPQKAEELFQRQAASIRQRIEELRRTKQVAHSE